jgi:hypothetical protein
MTHNNANSWDFKDEIAWSDEMNVYVHVKCALVRILTDHVHMKRLLAHFG